ncbi:MAG: pyridoxamine 5'-phosphate oxidase family protein [Aureispira sp.]
MSDIFHEGERRVQAKAGEAKTATSRTQLITNTIIKGAIGFIKKQPMVIVSSVDKEQQVWASILIGEHGFIDVPDANSFVIHLDKVYSNKEDVFYKNIANGSPIGTLFIELSSRRRFRINGTALMEGNKIHISVVEAYPNCPKYIQQRNIQDPTALQAIEGTIQQGTSFNSLIQDWITSSDTLFWGSISNGKRLDASHRGGKQGFVEILDDKTIKFPDYPGNSLFNTFGNVVQNKTSGLLFIDFKNRKTLQLTGEVDLLFDQNSAADLEKTGGTGRFSTFKVSSWIITENQHAANWTFLSNSPFNP